LECGGSPPLYGLNRFNQLTKGRNQSVSQSHPHVVAGLQTGLSGFSTGERCGHKKEKERR
jgi:hypothetical protein